MNANFLSPGIMCKTKQVWCLYKEPLIEMDYARHELMNTILLGNLTNPPPNTTFKAYGTFLSPWFVPTMTPIVH